MNLVPNYYHKFKCIADKCKHNCCIGWEIDIDADTMDYYKQIGIDKIEYTGDVPHFKLCEDDRCPYLLQNGLCEIISRFGEDALCDICADHPRFRNFYENFTETGLGLCCEEASRIILNEKESFSLVGEERVSRTKEEEEMWNMRKSVFDIIQNRDFNIKNRLLMLAREFDFEIPFGLQKAICDTYIPLERLDCKWTDFLNELTDFEFTGEIFDENNLAMPFEQLLCYFVFRHFPDGLYDGNFQRRMRFALSGCMLIGALCENYMKKNGAISMDIMQEFSRMYSSEVEYSEENINKLLSVL